MVTIDKIVEEHYRNSLSHTGIDNKQIENSIVKTKFILNDPIANDIRHVKEATENDENSFNKMMEQCNNINLTDSITTDKTTLTVLGKKIIDNKEGIIHIPADIFISNTIPLPNIEIVVDDSFNGIRKKVCAEFRISNNKLKVSDGELIGMFSIIISGNTKKILGILIISHNNELIWYVKGGHINVEGIVANLIFSWYCIQVLLLHPKLKYIFEYPKLFLLHEDKKTNNRKRKTKYIRKYRITLDNINNILFPDQNKKHSSHIITCPAWWVIGHYRIRNRKKEWVKGYWKGILRETKQNIDEGREREINTEDICI